MGEHFPTSVTDADLVTARGAVRRGIHGLVAALFGILAVTGLAAGAITAAAAGDTSLVSGALAVGAVSVAVGGPLVLMLSALTKRRALGISLETAVQGRVMETEARRREFETRLGRALEMAGDEVAAYDTVDRALHLAVPDTRVELLLADNSHAHLDRVVSVKPDAGATNPGCGVTSPDECVAARRAQTQVFPSSEELDGCPLLRDRGGDVFSAVCVPVSIMGRTVGVVHAMRPVDDPLADESVAALQVLANQSGNRLGMLRIMAETQLQASTDGLTGLMNRRNLENRARVLRAAGTNFALAMVDLDHFKSLNDTHGHESGDRALRVFAEVLRDGVRSEDYVCRYGGEEFVVLLPGVEIDEAIEVMERVRESLARTTRRGDVPSFTASAGIAHTRDSHDFEDLLLRADRALFAAKDAGRDCICIDGHTTAVAPNLTAIN
jgi:diguanylate cyclase (GGDEF)-like protein